MSLWVCFRSLQGSLRVAYCERIILGRRTTTLLVGLAHDMCSSKNASWWLLCAMSRHSWCVGAATAPLTVVRTRGALLLCASTVLSSTSRPAAPDLSVRAFNTSADGALLTCWYLNVVNTCRIFAMICSTQAFDSCEKFENWRQSIIGSGIRNRIRYYFI